MNKNNYYALSFLNLVFGILAIFLYLPYTLQAFDINVNGWLNFAMDIFKSNYIDILIYFGIFLLLWVIVLTIISIIIRINLPKLLFKLSAIVALILPLMYVLALKFDAVLDIWIKSIAPNVKIISYILISVSCGLFVLGLILNFTREKRANLHLIVQALEMCALLILIVAINGWCGWKVDYVKGFGVLMGLFAIYLPLSTIIISICAKKRV